MKIFAKNDDVKSVLAKIVAHLSLISDLSEDFFVTGVLFVSFLLNLINK